MAQSDRFKVYERLATTPLAAAGIRPGGMELTERALAFCPFAAGSVLLDIGCGSGVTLSYLQGVHGLTCVGIDASPVLLSEAGKRSPSVGLTCAHARRVPFRGNVFDGVILECTLSLMGDRVGTLREAHRVLRPRGRIILSDVYARNPRGIPRLRNLPMDCCLRGAMSQERSLEHVRAAGFEIDLWEDHSDLLKEFAVQLVWSYGSVAKFLGLGDEHWAGHQAAAESIRESRPGYFLLIGHKTVPDELSFSTV